MLLDILQSRYKSFLCLHEINIPFVNHPLPLFLTKDLCTGKCFSEQTMIITINFLLSIPVIKYAYCEEETEILYII